MGKSTETLSAIVQFLTARLDEVESVAQQADQDPAIVGIENERQYGRLSVPVAWLLADIAAKRAIIGWHSDNPHECEGPLGCEYVADEDSQPCSTMCALTLPYVDHADYNPEWKP